MGVRLARKHHMLQATQTNRAFYSESLSAWKKANNESRNSISLDSNPFLFARCAKRKYHERFLHWSITPVPNVNHERRKELAAQRHAEINKQRPKCWIQLGEEEDARLPCVWQENGTSECFITLRCGPGEGDGEQKAINYRREEIKHRASSRGRKWCQMYHYWVCGRQTGRKKSLKGSISVRYCVIDFWCLT